MSEGGSYGRLDRGLKPNFENFHGVYGCDQHFFLLPRRKIPRAEARTRFAVLLAARNEEAVIGRTVQQLLDQHYPRELFDVYVIPNNCTDDTEGVARRAGAQILPCLGTVRNKGDALHGAFAALKQAGYDAYCVFDADNLVDPDFPGSDE